MQIVDASASPASVKTGTRFLREWKGVTHEVIAIENGQFVYRGDSVPQPVRDRRRITGTHQIGTTFLRHQPEYAKELRREDSRWLSVSRQALRHLRQEVLEEGLDMSYNSLAAQSDACAAYIASQKQ